MHVTYFSVLGARCSVLECFNVTSAEGQRAIIEGQICVRLCINLVWARVEVIPSILLNIHIIITARKLMDGELSQIIAF